MPRYSWDMKPLNCTALAAMLDTKLLHFLQLRADLLHGETCEDLHCMRTTAVFLCAAWQSKAMFSSRRKSPLNSCLGDHKKPAMLMCIHLAYRNRLPAYLGHELHKNVNIVAAAEELPSATALQGLFHSVK